MFLGIFQKKKPGGRGRSGRRNGAQAVSSLQYGAADQVPPPRDWESEFAKVRETLEILENNYRLKDLSLEIRRNLDIAEKAHGLSLLSQVAKHLEVIEGLQSEINPILFLKELEEAGIATSEVEKSDVSDITGEKIFDASHAVYRTPLVVCAICAHMSRKFTGLSMRTQIASVLTGVAGDAVQRKWTLSAVLYLENKMYVLNDVGPPFFEVLNGRNQANFLTFTPQGGEARYIFSRKDLLPFALTNEKPKEHFVMPDIIVELHRKRNAEAKSLYSIMLVAGALGRTDLVYLHAQALLQQQIERSLEKQHIKGEFLAGPQQKEAVSRSPFMSEARDKGIMLEPEILDWLHALKDFAVDSFLPDVPFRPLDESLRFHVEITEIVYRRRRDASRYQSSGEREKVGEEKICEIAFFLMVGPWVYKLQLPEMAEKKKEELAVALPHKTTKKEKEAAVGQNYR